MIDQWNLFDQPVTNGMRTCENIQSANNGKNDGYKIG